MLSEKKPPSLGSSPSRLSTFEVNKEVKGCEGRDAPRFESVPGTTRIGAVSFNMAAPNSKRWETQVIQSSQALPDISAEGGRSPSPPKSPASPPMSPKPPRKAKRHPFDVQDHAYDLQDGRAHPVRTIPPMGWAGELREQRIMRAARMPGWADELREQSPKPLRSSRVNDLREQRMRAVRAPGWAGEFDMSPRASRRASWVSEMRDPSPGAVRTPGWAGELRELRFAVKQGAVEANPEAVKPRPLVVMTRFGKPPVTRMPPVVRAGYVHPLSERPEQRRRRLDQPLGMPVSPTGTASEGGVAKGPCRQRQHRLRRALVVARRGGVGRREPAIRAEPADLPQGGVDRGAEYWEGDCLGRTRCGGLITRVAKWRRVRPRPSALASSPTSSTRTCPMPSTRMEK